MSAWQSAAHIAESVNAGRTTAVAVVETTLKRIEQRDGPLNAFTAVTYARALARAKSIDLGRTQGKVGGSLAGVPFAVKNLFDIAGLPTLAGSKINRDRPPADRDARLIARLEAAGAVLVGALNMGEYAYDFTGENAMTAPPQSARLRRTCPADRRAARRGGGGRPGAARRWVRTPTARSACRRPFAAFSASSRPMAGCRAPAAFHSCASLDHLGPVGAHRPRDLALAYDAMQGPRSGRPRLRRPRGRTRGARP